MLGIHFLGMVIRLDAWRSKTVIDVLCSFVKPSLSSSDVLDSDVVSIESGVIDGDGISETWGAMESVGIINALKRIWEQPSHENNAKFFST